ncbi:uncharacterized protein TA14005 [Theileria annulata]|uniref:Uncharacterized protein n=1 Tax=Theileria annulata TaxID=5874 RepID=Q4UEU2_THEAN|nr:uncharacterized protein TA14005 [Theileria annulata]CAI74397.1 hypothetical protein TA14005 [Theileria annulata]|eukprot:XP_952129.1 hypothetical protein TA14005 [Theileria annulata]
MVNIFDEVRIIFRGPCERLFIAYKPFGWHVCSPQKKKFSESLSSVIGASLGIPEDSIKFPSKLKINQNGLVIGTTDSAMYSQITRIIENKQCTKCYTCLIDTNSSIFNHIGKGISELNGTIRFNLLQKKSQFEPNLHISNIQVTLEDSILSQDTGLKSMKFKLTSLEHLSNPENAMNWPETNMKSLSTYTNLLENNYSLEFQNKCLFELQNKYLLELHNKYLLELEVNDKILDKNLEEILDQLGINISNKFHTITLNTIQLPHPILKDKIITAKINFPLENFLSI